MTPALLCGHEKGPVRRRAPKAIFTPPLSRIPAALPSPVADLEALDQRHATVDRESRGVFQQLALAAAIRQLAHQQHLTPGQLLGAWVPEF